MAARSVTEQPVDRRLKALYEQDTLPTGELLSNMQGSGLNPLNAAVDQRRHGHKAPGGLYTIMGMMCVIFRVYYL